jgi:proteasome alpha subunit
MAMFMAPGAYDRAITVFSPDGRLFQVEYALETVKRGSTVLGIACPEGVVFAAEERMTSRLQDPNFSWKIFEIDEHVGAAISGLSSDARVLINQARIYAQSNKLTYDEPADIEVLSKRVGDVEQMYTQYGGIRPFGVSIIFGGVDKRGCKVLQTDPSGAVWAYKAVSVGAGSETVRGILEQKYRDDLTLDDAILLAVECLSHVIEGKLEPENMKIATIPAATRKMTHLSNGEIAKYIGRLNPKAVS